MERPRWFFYQLDWWKIRSINEWIFSKIKIPTRKSEIQLDLSDYKKADLKNSIGADTSDFAKKSNLVHLKSDVDKSDNDKLKNVPNALSNLKSNINKLDIDKLETTPVDLS